MSKFPVQWIPLTLTSFYVGITSYNSHGFIYRVVLFLFGLLLWTLGEYLAHRFLFHIEPTNRVGNFCHFLMHGIHHLTPLGTLYFPNKSLSNMTDDTRLTFPIPLAAAASFAILYLWSVISPAWFPYPLMLTGTATGYMIYDAIHYYFHHSTVFAKLPLLGHYLSYMKSRHIAHHYSNQNVNFGVSNPLWDFVFTTSAE